MIGLRNSPVTSPGCRVGQTARERRHGPLGHWKSLAVFFQIERPRVIAVSPLESIRRCVVLESGILPSAFHFVSIKLVCCLSCCPLRCGPQERNCVPDGALLRRGGKSASLATPAANAGARGKRAWFSLRRYPGSQSSATFPGGFRPHVIDQEAHALVVGRIQPEHTIENAPSLVETAEAPKA